MNQSKILNRKLIKNWNLMNDTFIVGLITNGYEKEKNIKIEPVLDNELIILEKKKKILYNINKDFHSNYEKFNAKYVGNKNLFKDDNKSIFEGMDKMKMLVDKIDLLRILLKLNSDMKLEKYNLNNFNILLDDLINSINLKTTINDEKYQSIYNWIIFQTIFNEIKSDFKNNKDGIYIKNIEDHLKKLVYEFENLVKTNQNIIKDNLNLIRISLKKKVLKTKYDVYINFNELTSDKMYLFSQKIQFKIKELMSLNKIN